MLRHFLPIFGFCQFLQVFDISRGQKKHFFPKSDPNGLVSEEEKIHCIFRYLLHFLLKGSLS